MILLMNQEFRKKIKISSDMLNEGIMLAILLFRTLVFSFTTPRLIENSIQCLAFLLRSLLGEEILIPMHAVNDPRKQLRNRGAIKRISLEILANGFYNLFFMFVIAKRIYFMIISNYVNSGRLIAFGIITQ